MNIYHEKQDAALCAVHSLNNLLQGSYFSEVDLTQFAHKLDEEEKKCMAVSGVDSKEFMDFTSKGSNNVSDEGNFSVQVIAEALKVWDLFLIHYDSPEGKQIQQNPTNELAYICNHMEHWFTLRKFGEHWFNLNSTLQSPVYLSPTYIGLFLEQLRTEGYSIFVVRGQLPKCSADEEALFADVNELKNKYSKMAHLHTSSAMTSSSIGGSALMSTTGTSKTEQQMIDEAIQLSLKSSNNSQFLDIPTLHNNLNDDNNDENDDDDDDDEQLELARAISLSLSQDEQNH